MQIAPADVKTAGEKRERFVNLTRLTLLLSGCIHPQIIFDIV
jgi:hypothetical protein